MSSAYLCSCGGHSEQDINREEPLGEVTQEVVIKSSPLADQGAPLKQTPGEERTTVEAQRDVDSIDISQTKMPVQPHTYRRGPNQPDAFLRRFFEVASQVPHRKAKRALKQVLSDPSTFHFQLIITEVEPKTHALTPHEYRVDLDYLYPASAIKTFASLASLMYFEELSHKHPWISRDDALSFHAKRCHHPDRTNLSSGRMTLAHEIKQTQLVSSNRAFNHVFDIVGSERLHEYLLPLFPSLRVYHRLSTNETHEETLRVPALSICDANKKKIDQTKRVTLRAKSVVLSDQNAPSLNHLEPYTGYGDSRESLEVGVAYIDAKSKELVRKPMDFTWKNRVSLYDFQRLMFSIYKPQLTHQAFGVPISLQKGHKIHADDLNMLRASMITYPHDSKDPKYKGKGLSETRFKPLIKGIRLSDKAVDAQGEGKGIVADANLYYLNKAGKALGFHLDNALIAVGNGKVKLNKDYTLKNTRRALYVTVGLYVNQNGILNDNQYEYSKVSVPLFDAIGYAVGEYLQGKL